MLLIYFRQKVKKNALELLALQGLVIVGLSVFISLEVSQDNSQKMSFMEGLDFDYELFSDFLRKDTGKIVFLMESKIDKERRIKPLWDCAKGIQKYTNQYIEELEAETVSTGLKSPANLSDFLGKYSDGVGGILVELNQGVYGEMYANVPETIEGYSLSTNEVLLKRYGNLETKTLKNAYINKVKNEVWQFENKLIYHLYNHIPNTCDIGVIKNYVIVLAEKRLWEGETLNARILLARNIETQSLAVIVGNDTLKRDVDGMGIYKTKVNGIGKHQLEGKIITENGWGKTQTYSFSHEYTVLPKCN